MERLGQHRPYSFIPSRLRRPAGLVLCCAAWAAAAGNSARGQATVADTPVLAVLPDSPGALLEGRAVAPLGAPVNLSYDDGGPEAQTGGTDNKLPLCDSAERTTSPEANASSTSAIAADGNCRHENPVQPVVTSRRSEPLTSRQKGELALRDIVDPFNLLTITAYSAFAVSVNSHSAYGPGFEGWGKLIGYSAIEDSQGEFFGTYLISSLAREDPRYHRMPNATVKRRLLHAILHTYVSQHDDGTRMPNYATLLTYPISAELSNLYVPGVPTNLRSTAQRVGIGLASAPSGTLIAEFLPDIAKRIHVRVIFIQEILNQVITGGTAPNVQ